MTNHNHGLHSSMSGEHGHHELELGAEMQLLDQQEEVQLQLAVAGENIIEIDLHGNIVSSGNLDLQGQGQEGQIFSTEDQDQAEANAGDVEMIGEEYEYTNEHGYHQEEQTNHNFSIEIEEGVRSTVQKGQATSWISPAPPSNPSPSQTQQTHHNNSKKSKEIVKVSDAILRKILSPAKIRNKDIMELPFSYAGQSFTVQAQKLILNVYDFFKRNKNDPYILRKLGCPQEQAGKILNVSSSVIGKIRNRFKALGRIEVPGQRRRKVKRILDNVDSLKEQVIRDTVQELASKR